MNSFTLTPHRCWHFGVWRLSAAEPHHLQAGSSAPNLGVTTQVTMLVSPVVCTEGSRLSWQRWS